MGDSTSYGHGWDALTKATDALQSSELFRKEVAPALNQEAYYGPAGVIIFVVLIGKLAYALDIGSYRRLDDSARLTLINRSLFCLVYLVSFAPYTVSAYFIFFSPTSSAGLGSSDLQTQLKAWALRLLSVLLGVQLSMHVFEGGCRSIVDVDYFLVLHHIVQCAFPVLAFQSQSPFVLKVTVVISCFASYEFLLHAALICSKMPVLRTWFRWLTILGVAFYGATRLFQTFFLVVLFKVGYGPMNTSKGIGGTNVVTKGSTNAAPPAPTSVPEVQGHSGSTIALYWITLFMCIVITAQQLWKIVVYRNVWRNTTARPARTASGTIKVPGGPSHRLRSAKIRRSQDSPSQPEDTSHQGIKSMVRSVTRAASSELTGDDADRPAELTRGNVLNSDGSDIYTSQNVLLDNIVEDEGAAAKQAADSAV